MRRMEIAESVLIVLALASLWLFVIEQRSLWHNLVWLLMLAAMAWVAVRRLRRIRAATDEAKRIRDEAERGARPPSLTP